MKPERLIAAEYEARKATEKLALEMERQKREEDYQNSPLGRGWWDNTKVRQVEPDPKLQPPAGQDWSCF